MRIRRAGGLAHVCNVPGFGVPFLDLKRKRGDAKHGRQSRAWGGDSGLQRLSLPFLPVDALSAAMPSSSGSTRLIRPAVAERARGGKASAKQFVGVLAAFGGTVSRGHGPFGNKALVACDVRPSVSLFSPAARAL